MRRTIALLTAALVPVLAAAQSGEPPSVITEQRGKVTNMRIAGSLESTQEVACIELDAARNSYTPPDLYRGVIRCIDQNRLDLAAGLFALAGAYSRFDAERVSDTSARQARTVLLMTTFQDLSESMQERFSAAVNGLLTDADRRAALCGAVGRVGMPDYYPSYMILHGIGAFTGDPHANGLRKDFDAQATWTQMMDKFLRCAR